jgi:hypothetical protein
MMYLKEKCLQAFFHHFWMIQNGLSLSKGSVPSGANGTLPQF